MTCLPHATLPVPLVVLLWRPMTSSSRHTEWHGKTLRTKQQAQNLFSTWKKHRGPSAQASMFISCQKLHSYPPPQEEKELLNSNPCVFYMEMIDVFRFLWKFLVAVSGDSSFSRTEYHMPDLSIYSESSPVCQFPFLHKTHQSSNFSWKKRCVGTTVY